ncbi:hypothetical protein CYLTODRAFT_425993 [Cylindrobasidium torrendii FP15055 ss-10]|uniref:Uncharacterized protein n=1 Tax=Cylindrobasidium torrendii FP15055 ss-10 TaxID=1314674 RepID=A0A0D7B094_9AGAR|nr:hypothetical protein CYLTODRAFT_425993 [Cylindrobasidium torrendii FP15055 ss-10]
MYQEFTELMQSMAAIVKCKQLVVALQGAYRHSVLIGSSSGAAKSSIPVTGETPEATPRRTSESIVDDEGNGDEGTSSYTEDFDEIFANHTFRHSGIEHAIEYYRTLTAWTQATNQITTQIPRRPNHHVEFHLVSAAALFREPRVPTLTREDVTTFMKDYPGVRACYPFNKISDVGDKFELVKGDVHCEALGSKLKCLQSFRTISKKFL